VSRYLLPWWCHSLTWGNFTYDGTFHLMMTYDKIGANIAWWGDTWNLCFTLSWRDMSFGAFYTTLDDNIMIIALTHSHVLLLEGIYDGRLEFMTYFTHWWGVIRGLSLTYPPCIMHLFHFRYFTSFYPFLEGNARFPPIYRGIATSFGLLHIVNTCLLLTSIYFIFYAMDV